MATCPECGVDEDSIAVPDAIAAIRTFPRRYREALSGITDASEALVSRAAATSSAAWERPFTVGTDQHLASWIVAHAAHEGSHHLRDIERVGRRVGGATEDDD